MNERVISIEKYYTNLEYKDGDKMMKSLQRIHYLSLELSFMETDNFAYRFLRMATIMEENLNLFMSVCQHVDSVLGILNSLYFYGATFKLQDEVDCDDDVFDIIENFLITIFYTYKEYAIQEYLENIIVDKTKLEWYYKYKNLLKYLQVEIIILEDSDLHAIINDLKYNRVVACLKKIWVQKSIIHTFMWHFKKNVKLNVPIQIFQSKQEVLTPSTYENNILDKNITVNFVCIWSEDVTAAKNLARSLNKSIAFINMHMDICPNALVPIRQIFHPAIKSFDLITIDKCKNNLINPTTHKDLPYNLFYDGKWQKPKKNTYWKHENNLFANATSQDIIECFKSATKGFKNLSTMSSDSRRQMLSNFATILECHGQFSLSEVVSKWISMSYIYEKMSYYVKTEKFEVISICKPKSIVILKEEDETALFQELTQNLIIGNSVIVICNPNLCILAPYCNMFKMCRIPSGVINLLSITNNVDIENCDVENVENLEKALKKFTIMQHIFVPRK